MSDSLRTLEQAVGYTFKNKQLLQMALRHRSAGPDHNERLEFLGDAVLGIVISKALYHQHKAAEEGVLSRMRSSLVNRSTLAAIGRHSGLHRYIELGPGEHHNGGTDRDSIIADAQEALIGAVYLDSDMVTTEQWLLAIYAKQVGDLGQVEAKKDAKTALQEWLQARQHPLPDYQVQAQGKAHALCFTVVCHVVGFDCVGHGSSHRRRDAEQLAAADFLRQIND